MNVTMLTYVVVVFVVCFQLASGVIPSTAGEFLNIKSGNGWPMCAVDDPSMTTSARSPIHCAVKCRTQQGTRCRGVNYRKRQQVCQMYVDRPMRLQAVDDCQYMEIGVSRPCIYIADAADLSVSTL